MRFIPNSFHFDGSQISISSQGGWGAKRLKAGDISLFGAASPSEEANGVEIVAQAQALLRGQRYLWQAHGTTVDAKKGHD